MALIKCVECGKEMSSSAVKCPHCGSWGKWWQRNTPFTISLMIGSFMFLFFVCLVASMFW